MLKGQQIVKNRGEIIKLLNQAAAAETVAAYYYRYLALYASGLHGRQVAAVFEEMSSSEWEHAKGFMERIFQLGGKPFDKLSEADKVSFSKCPPPPKSPTDWKKMLKNALAMEQDAIEFYRSCMEKIHEDPVTLHLVREALEDEVEDESTIAALLE